MGKTGRQIQHARRAKSEVRQQKVSAFCHYASSPGLTAPPDRRALSDKPPTAQWHHPRSGGQRSDRRPLFLAAAVLTRIGPAELGADGRSIRSWRHRRIKKSDYLSCLRLSRWPGALRFRPLRREQRFDNGPQHQGQRLGRASRNSSPMPPIRVLLGVLNHLAPQSIMSSRAARRARISAPRLRLSRPAIRAY